MRQIEHFAAVSLMQWWAYMADKFGVDSRLLAAIPNGGHRHIGTARKLKAEGVKAGMPDYFLFVPRGTFHGLALELKADTKTARLSDAQRTMKELIESRGYQFRVCYGTEEATDAIEDYMGLGSYGTITKREWANMDAGPMDDLAEVRR